MSIRPALLGAAAGTILATVAYVSLADAALNRPAPAAAGQRPVAVAPTTADPTAAATDSPAPCEPPSVLTGQECVVTIVHAATSSGRQGASSASSGRRSSDAQQSAPRSAGGGERRGEDPSDDRGDDDRGDDDRGDDDRGDDSHDDHDNDHGDDHGDDHDNDHGDDHDDD